MVKHSTGQAEDGYRAGRAVSAEPNAFEKTYFVDITAGRYHSCGLTSSGGVKCWGDNFSSQLGDGTTSFRRTPVDVLGLGNGAIAVAAGEYHTCALTSGGGVKCWGGNHYGQLGDGTRVDSSTPVAVVGLDSGITAIATGEAHTCTLTSGGKVKCWGLNYSGQLGNGTTDDSVTPVDVVGLSSAVSAIVTGSGHNCVLVSSGRVKVKCWGSNYYGELGDGTMADRSTPVDVVGLGSGVAVVAAGGGHTCALTLGGGVKCWGRNWYGQLGDGSTTNRNVPVDVIGLENGMSAVAAGGDHTCALTLGGGVKCWGRNDEYGQVGDGSTINRNEPVDVVGLQSGVATVALGSNHTCVLTSRGEVKCWGDNGTGQLGVSPIRDRSIPVDVVGLTGGITSITAGTGYTCALTSSNGVKCWGSNLYGQLGVGTTTDSSTPVDIVDLSSGVVAVTAGTFSACALTTVGGVKCWGGATSTSPVDVFGLESGMVAVSVGTGHNCALSSEGGVKCWGGNNYGQLGDGTTEPRTAPVDVVGLGSGVSAIAAGGYHTCALISGGEVKCWGINNYGQLGNDSTAEWSSVPVSVIGLSSRVTLIASGEDHTCAVTSGGGVKCWGWNLAGQLGDGTTTNRHLPVDVVGLESTVAEVTADINHTCALTTGGGVKCWGYYQSDASPVDITGLSSGVTAIDAGNAHNCALVGNGRPKCWGSDWYGELGTGTVLSRQPTPVDMVETILPYLTVNYPNGHPGSYFTITGWEFPPDTLATLSINNQIITTTLAVNPTGNFILFLDSTGAEAGYYNVTASADQSVSTGFFLAESAPLRSQEGGGQAFTVPAGLAYQNSVYLPFVRR